MSQVSRWEYISRRVVATVLAGLIVAALLSFLPGCWAFLWASVTLPRAVFWFLLLFFVGDVASAAALILLATPWRDYQEDRFYGLTWRWKWSLGGEVEDPWCYCPSCDRTMVYETRLDPTDNMLKTVVACRVCSTNLVQDGRLHHLLNAVRSEIELKVRHGLGVKKSARH